MTDQPVYIGIDAGGTKTVIQSSAGKRISGPGTNLQRDTVSGTTAHLVNVLQPVLPPATTRMYLCAGVAGAGRTADQAQLQDALAEKLQRPASSIKIVSDAALAYYAAHQDRSGIVLIIGTGSIFWARTKTGQMVRSGGWGSLLGDEGGGFQLGLAALRAITHEIDGGPTTSLSALLCERAQVCNASDVLAYVHNEKEKIALLAPDVLLAAEQEDAVARAIVHEQLASLSRNFEYLLLAHPHIALDITLHGGLTRNAFYVHHVQGALLTINADLNFVQEKYTPAEGALLMANKEGRMGTN